MSVEVGADPAADSLFAELAVTTGLGDADWRDVLTLDPVDARLCVEGWQVLGKLGWAREPTRSERVLAILNEFAQWAAPIGIIAGACTGVGAAIRVAGGSSP